MLRARKAISLATSSELGGTPIILSPAPATSKTMLVMIIAMVTTPAKNLPLITASLKMGWDRRRPKVPLFFSSFMASKPRAMPIIGIRKTAIRLRNWRKPGKFWAEVV